MKIRIGEAEIGVEITQKMLCRAGTAYHQIDYTYRGICIYSVSTGAIYGQPNPLGILDVAYEWSIPHYQDIPEADPMPEGENRVGRTIKRGTFGGREAWWEVHTKTHRQAIIDAIAQIITD